MTRLLPLAVVGLLAACSADVGIPSDPGAYVKKTADTEAQLIVVTAAKQSLVIQGTFKNETPIPTVLGRLAPASISGMYSVTTANCGTLHFIEAKGGGLFCEKCELMNMNRNLYSACELSKLDIPSVWFPIGI